MKILIPEKISELALYLENKMNVSDKELIYAIKNLNIGLSDIGNFVNFNHELNQNPKGSI